MVRPVFQLAARNPLRLREDKEQSPQELENAKKEQFNSKEKRQELESNSEAHVKADRQNVKDHDQHMEDLQKQTAQQKEKEHPAGKA
ncbi:unnamed protein product [Zymoseptoria tritici ST99CH_1A5]|uniref:Uncharacterized protein n=2 Tax=Zymoseptoria tritici TaxID=1047171 RepID=A0A2H1GAF3_ZYMTR|nr:unnamed protein product [Zymoseptoria tritici ST99CH_1E4]SMR51483.1 unnamed protein product [Zymoseptoria tritici ST99CH_3D1]SMY23240.1 unnamed protein product [Zymoseptoria tritici ST99CH_1A5]